MTTTTEDRTITAVLAAMRYMASRQARLEAGVDEESHVGQYRIGKADGLATAIELLAETTGIDAAEYLEVDPILRHARDLSCAWDSAADLYEPAALRWASGLFAQLAEAIPDDVRPGGPASVVPGPRVESEE